MIYSNKQSSSEQIDAIKHKITKSIIDGFFIAGGFALSILALILCTGV